MIGISACLCGENCTYRGDSNRQEELALLAEKGEVVKVCPEVLGGLPIPRTPAEITSRHPLKVTAQDGRDVTKEYVEGSKKALEILKENGVKTVILKGRSPSCGIREIYDGTFTHTRISGNGVFAAMCLEEGMNVYNEDDYQLVNKEEEL